MIPPLFKTSARQKAIFSKWKKLILCNGKLLICAVFVAITLQRCGGEKSDANENAGSDYSSQEQANFVRIAVVKKTIFNKEILSNGKLKAFRKSELKFRVNGELKQLLVRNGQLVNAQQIIAKLDPFEYEQRLNQAETVVKTAALEMEDMLLGYGGFRIKKDSIASEIKETLASKSGYISAKRELKTAEYNLEGTILKSPFSGKAANIKHHVYEQVSSGDPFCIIIDDSQFEVEFYLVESEIHEIKLNDIVKVIPFSESTIYKGFISEINPLVDKNGLIFIKAQIKNTGSLWEGMNVKIVVEKQIFEQLVVPKSSIVLRQNQEVLFKYEKGKAIWTYVKTGMENSSSYTVETDPDKGGALQAGDTIIISENLNLAHQSKVAIK